MKVAIKIKKNNERWWPLSDLPHLAFDHYDIMQDAIQKYKEIVK